MELYIYDKLLNGLGIVDEFKSLIWTVRFYGVGVFELQAPMTENNIALLQKNRYIYRPDVGEAGFIRSITEQRQDGEELIVVSGSMLEGLLDKRIIEGSKLSENSNVKSVVSTICNGASDLSRFDCLYNELDGTEYPVNADADGCNMGEYIRSLLAADGCRIRIVPYMSDKKLICRYDRGVDRSTEQDVNPHIIFSSEFDNINNQVYNYSDEGCCNYVKVIADMEGKSWDETKGLEYPLYIEKYPEGAGGLDLNMYICYSEPVIVKEQRYDAEGNRYEVNVLDYSETFFKQNEIVKQYYSEASENFEGEVYGGYRTEWALGDRVTVKDEARGISYIKQIEEVTESFEGNEVSTAITLGAALKTIIDAIKEAKKK